MEREGGLRVGMKLHRQRRMEWLTSMPKVTTTRALNVSQKEKK